jgi:hypothetical protein
MSVIRVGSTSKYADGWDAVFGRSRSGTAAGKKPGKKASPAKTAAAKAKKTSAAVTKKAATKARKAGRKRRG